MKNETYRKIEFTAKIQVTAELLHIEGQCDDEFLEYAERFIIERVEMREPEWCGGKIMGVDIFDWDIRLVGEQDEGNETERDHRTIVGKPK